MDQNIKRSITKIFSVDTEDYVEMQWTLCTLRTDSGFMDTSQPQRTPH